MCNFKVGQRVVNIVEAEKVVLGEIYTVKGFVTGRLGGQGITLIEVEPSYGKVGFYANKFRPLDELFANEIETYIKEKVKEESLVNI